MTPSSTRRPMAVLSRAFPARSSFRAVSYTHLYTGTFLSLDGRTNGMFMAMWGMLGVLWIKALLPKMLDVVNLIPWKLRYLSLIHI